MHAPDRRSKTRTTLIIIILATLPFYCVGIIMLGISRVTQGSPNKATPTIALTISPTAAPFQPTSTVTPFSFPTATYTATPTVTFTATATWTPFLTPTRTQTIVPSVTWTPTLAPATPTLLPTTAVVPTEIIPSATPTLDIIPSATPTPNFDLTPTHSAGTLVAEP